ncbi:hypothetical protein [Nonomuraea longicatena]|uniref:Uncharacterized protein n=1 Tax=Nonomuraea longicatena TaxID=83682 RepID=A0ABN1Q6H8_9ACTN
MWDSVRSNWEPFNEPLESREHNMYLDTKGFVSTGVGNLIDATAKPLTPPTPDERARSLAMAGELDWLNADGSEASSDQVAAEWDLVKSRMDLAPRGGGVFRGLTTLRISDDEIDRFVGKKLDQFEAFLKNRSEFADFDNWPADAQLGLLSMAWGMGPAFQFPRFQALAAAGDFDAAAGECRFNPEIGTIVTRNNLDQQCFHNAAQVVNQGLDRSALLTTAGG